MKTDKKIKLPTLVLIHILAAFNFDYFIFNKRLENMLNIFLFREFNNLNKSLISKIKFNLYYSTLLKCFKDPFLSLRFLQIFKNLVFENKLIEKTEIENLINLIHAKKFKVIRIYNLLRISYFLQKYSYFYFAYELETIIINQLKENDKLNLSSAMIYLNFNLFENPTWVSNFYLRYPVLKKITPSKIITKILKSILTKEIKKTNYISGPTIDLINQKGKFKSYNFLKTNDLQFRKIINSKIGLKQVWIYFSKLESPDIRLVNRESFKKINLVFDESGKNIYSIPKSNYSIIDRKLNYLLFNGFPFHVQRVILHLFLKESNNLFYLSGMNFHLGDLYPKDYHGFKYFKEEYSFYQSIHAWHSFLSNFRFLKQLYNLNLVKADKEIVALLKRDFKDIMNLYELKFPPKSNILHSNL